MVENRRRRDGIFPEGRKIKQPAMRAVPSASTPPPSYLGLIIVYYDYSVLSIVFLQICKNFRKLPKIANL